MKYVARALDAMVGSVVIVGPFNMSSFVKSSVSLSEETPEKQSPFAWLGSLKHRKKELFWAWITYQAVKGLLTTSLIWIPLFMWWRSGS